METKLWLSPITLLIICTGLVWSVEEDAQHDAREGEDVTLRCRFAQSLGHQQDTLTYYWVRSTASSHDNVAIGNIPLETNYQIQYAPSEGRYDLMVSKVSYERDNGRFECRVKAGGSGRTLHSEGHALTVLTAPRPPTISPSGTLEAQEGKDLVIECSTSGGSPEPSIKWFRNGSEKELAAKVTHGRTRAERSVAILTLSPTREDDGAIYRCVVWNRALPEHENFDASVSLSVSYFPRVEVGPENPLRVEVGGSATLECRVDAKPKVNSVRWTRSGKFVSNAFTHTLPAVTADDAGQYSCSADNGLERKGEAELVLDVQYPPTVSLPASTHEVEEGGSVDIRCDVNANPAPISIEWTLEGDAGFRQRSNTLVLRDVTAAAAGTYVCKAANMLSGGERVGRASVAVLVRHRPGRAKIVPERPTVTEGATVTLTCSAQPPGWPAPQYRWYRDLDRNSETKPTAITTGAVFTVTNAHLGSEGVYSCLAANELGHGEMASAELTVQQAPRVQARLPAHASRVAGERGVSVTCSALGKPRPTVTWYKDGAPLPDNGHWEVTSDEVSGEHSVYNVSSTLTFRGRARQGGDELLPSDSGDYVCAFENDVRRVDSTMHLRIEHKPFAVQHAEKIAFDVGETAELTCSVRAYPRPDFRWYFGATSAPLPAPRYEATTTAGDGDMYRSVLRVKDLTASDYGDYRCHVTNTLGGVELKVRLQGKGAPDAPRALVSSASGANYVTLRWDSGFDGGLDNTKYFVRYKRVSAGAETSSDAGCVAARAADADWLEYDCNRSNPCNVTQLHPHTAYVFKVKAVNTMGHSNHSNEVRVSTGVGRIPPPEQVTWEPSTRTAAFSLPPTCLALVAVAEAPALSPGNHWQVVEVVPVVASGSVPTVHESTLDDVHNTAARDEANARLRLKLCLQINQELCSEYTDAEIGPSYIKGSSSLSLGTLLVVGCSFIVFALVLGLLYLFCRRRRREHKAARHPTMEKKDHDEELMTTILRNAPQHQAPPPYYPPAGMDNKALATDDPKNMLGRQPLYGYHMTDMPTHMGQTMPPDWNGGYGEQYAHSNNGGSVDSQDSLWQMKFGAAPPPPHHDPAYGYAGYADYAHYPPAAQPPPSDDYALRHTPSRQDYCSDPYASVHKPKKRMDQHIESPYHEVSGLPETLDVGGGEAVGGAGGPLSLSYDESGYSTPDARARRVIREIIV